MIKKRPTQNARRQLFYFLLGSALFGRLRRPAVSVSAGQSISGTTVRPRQNVRWGARRRGTSAFLKKRWYIVALLLVVLVAAVCASNPIVTAVSPLLAVSDAASNTMDALSNRFEATPLVMLRILAASTQYGKINAAYSFTDPAGAVSGGDARFLLNGIGRDFSAHTTLISGQQDISCSLLLDQDRFAFKTARTDGRFYGIGLDTYKDDLASYAAASDTSAETLLALADLLAFLEMEIHSNNIAAYEEFSKIIVNFVNELTPVESREKVMINGERVTCKTVTIELEDSVVKEFLRELYDFFSQSLSLIPAVSDLNTLAADLTGADWTAESGGAWKDKPIEMLGALLDTFEKYYHGPLTITFDINSGTLVRCVAIVPDITRDGKALWVSAVFGRNPETDDLSVTIRDTDQNGSLVSMVTLSTDGDQDRNINTLGLTYGGGAENVTVTTDWLKTTGSLTVDVTRPGSAIHANGTLLVTAGAFDLSFVELPAGGGQLGLTLSAEKEGVSVPSSVCLDIDRWGPAFFGGAAETGGDDGASYQPAA